MPRPRASEALGKIRRVIDAVPRGRVITYGDAAAAAGYSRAPRLAVRALQGARELPWHRVVAAGGRIALPGADGAEQKLRLRIEGVIFRNGKVRMDLHAWSPRIRRSPRRESRPRPQSLRL